MDYTILYLMLECWNILWIKSCQHLQNVTSPSWSRVPLALSRISCVKCNVYCDCCVHKQNRCGMRMRNVPIFSKLNLRNLTKHYLYDLWVRHTHRACAVVQSCDRRMPPRPPNLTNQNAATQRVYKREHLRLGLQSSCCGSVYTGYWVYLRSNKKTSFTTYSFQPITNQPSTTSEEKWPP